MSRARFFERTIALTAIAVWIIAALRVYPEAGLAGTLVCLMISAGLAYLALHLYFRDTLRTLRRARRRLHAAHADASTPRTPTPPRRARRRLHAALADAVRGGEGRG